MASTSVRVAITDDLFALSGTFTQAGVSVGVGDVVGVFRDTPSADSGIYTVQSGAWTRHPDYDSAAEFQPGVLVVYVREGTHARRNFQFRNSDVPADPLGTTLLNFEDLERWTRIRWRAT